MIDFIGYAASFLLFELYHQRQPFIHTPYQPRGVYPLCNIWLLHNEHSGDFAQCFFDSSTNSLYMEVYSKSSETNLIKC